MKATVIMLIFLTLTQFTVKMYKFGKPTFNGVDNWIEVHQYDLGDEYQRLVGDTLYDYYISSDDLRDYYEFDSLELGITFLPADIIINNRGNFIDYAVDSISKWRRKTTYSNAFVKGVVFHELTHVWINQILREMDYLGYYISPEYRNFKIYSSRERNFGAEFIEEGICEYIPNKSEDILYADKPEFIPGSLSDIDGSYRIKYQYSEYLVGRYLNQFTNLKEGIMILFSNQPPTKLEMLSPELYFRRLNMNIK